MQCALLSLLALGSSLALAAAPDEENIVYTDGTGAMICYRLSTIDEVDERAGMEATLVKIRSFRLSVTKDDKILLLTDLPGKVTADGRHFSGSIIIPAEFVESAEIVRSGGVPNTSRGVNIDAIKVRDFKIVTRKKCWTEQE